MRPAPSLGRLRAFTLVEVMIAASIGLIATGVIVVIILDTLRISATGKLQQDFADDARLLRNRFGNDALGCQVYQVHDSFTSRQPQTDSGTMMTLAYMDNMASLTPKLTRIVCYYLDTTNSQNVGHYVLRRIDSAEASSLTWPPLNVALLSTHSLAQFLPPVSEMSQGKALAQIDFASGNAAQLPRYQLFYPQQGVVSANLLLRYGNNQKSYVAPVQINFTIRK